MQKFKKAFGVMDADDSGDWVRYDDAMEFINAERNEYEKYRKSDVTVLEMYANELTLLEKRAKLTSWLIAFFIVENIVLLGSMAFYFYK